VLSDFQTGQIIRYSCRRPQLPISDGRTVHIRKASVPDPEQAQVYKILAVDWKKAFPTVKSVFNPYPIL